MAAPIPELTQRQRNLRTLGLFFLVFLGPLLVLRVACVSHREVCEHAGGIYGEHGNVRVCNMPNSEGCPDPYRYARARDGCVVTTRLPGVWRWDSW